MNGSKSTLVHGTPGTQLTIEQDELKSIVENNESVRFFSSKSEAIAGTMAYPQQIAISAKRFFKGSSSGYRNYSITRTEDGFYHFVMEKPGDVPGSKALYHKIVSSDGSTLKVYKDTFDPDGKLVHRKDKIK